MPFPTVILVPVPSLFNSIGAKKNSPGFKSAHSNDEPASCPAGETSIDTQRLENIEDMENWIKGESSASNQYKQDFYKTKQAKMINEFLAEVSHALSYTATGAKGFKERQEKQRDYDKYHIFDLISKILFEDKIIRLKNYCLSD